MNENLDQFFDTTNGFAVNATFKNAAGATIRTTKVNFIDAAGALEDVNSEGARPFLECKKADLQGVDHTCKVTIGNTTYRIISDRHDGAIAIVVLQP